MKAKFYCLFAFLLLVSGSTRGVVHIVNQVGTEFSPSTLNVNVGDTVRWLWSSGSHTTTSQTVPNGAEFWDAPLNSTNMSFEYKVTVEGSYSYACTPHQGIGMVGDFVASTPTSVAQEAIWAFNIYPNPATTRVFISTNNSQEVSAILLTSIIGLKVFFKKISTNYSEFPFEIDLSTLNSGIYLVTIEFVDSRRKTQKLKVGK